MTDLFFDVGEQRPALGKQLAHLFAAMRSGSLRHAGGEMSNGLRWVWDDQHHLVRLYWDDRSMAVSGELIHCESSGTLASLVARHLERPPA